MSARLNKQDAHIMALGRAFEAFGREGLCEHHLVEIRENIKWLVDDVKRRRQARIDKLQTKLF